MGGGWSPLRALEAASEGFDPPAVHHPPYIGNEPCQLGVYAVTLACLDIRTFAQPLRRLTQEAAMIEARTYADPGSTHGTRLGLLTRVRRLWTREAPDAARNPSHEDTIVVTADEFERVRQCLSSPHQPSAAAIEGADILRRLPTPKP